MRTYNSLRRALVFEAWNCQCSCACISLGLLILLALVAPADVARALAGEPGRSQSRRPLVRTDGVYYLTQPDSGSAPRHRVVRFYDDGAAVEADVSGDPGRKANWLSRDDPKLLPGRWTMEGNELVFRLSTGFEERTRRGRLTEEGWVITEKVVFKFAPVSFPREADKGKNRRPYFVGPGKGTRIFQYDDAGRRTGVHHQMEIEAQDPDGDPITITWKVSNGAVVGEGAKVLWKANGPGMVTVVVTDGRGGRIESSIDLN